MTRAVDAVVNVNHAPLSVKAFPVGSPVACAASIVDVEHRYPPARPVLNGLSKRSRCLNRRATMADSDERWLITSECLTNRHICEIVEIVCYTNANGHQNYN